LKFDWLRIPKKQRQLCMGWVCGTHPECDKCPGLEDQKPLDANQIEKEKST